MAPCLHDLERAKVTMTKRLGIDLDNFQVKGKLGTIISLCIAIVAAIYFFIENKSLKEGRMEDQVSIKELREENKNLQGQLSVLEGWKSGVNNTIQMFMENPPSLMQGQLDELKDKVEQYHGQISRPRRPDTVFVNRVPE